MSAITPTDVLLNRSFRLAYFILGDRMASMYLTAAALDKLKIASAAQGRRLHYVPTGGSALHAGRTKVNLNRLHLLQLLIYKEAEAFERLQEAMGTPPRQEDMVIRYVKHLVMVATRRNSFHVSLGLCRLLYNYTTAETSEIYNLLLQDPDRSRDDHYFRTRKVRMMRELGERFGDALQLRRGHRGEERFEPQEDSSKYMALVGECLSRFTPWDSPCVLPADIDLTREVTPLHCPDGVDPDGGHEVELNRIHTLLHPGCFERLTASLRLDPPSRRLEVPRFFNAAADRGLTEDRFEPGPLRAEELDALRRYLNGNEAQREGASRKLLAVLIDGEERARFEVAGTGRVSVRTGAGSTWLEVRSVEERETVTLAMHRIPYHASEVVPRRPYLTRGAGYTLSFDIEPSEGHPAVAADATISVKHRERSAASRLFSQAGRFRALLLEAAGTARLGAAGRPRLALVSFLMIACAAGLLLYLVSRTTPPAGPPPAGPDLIARSDVHDQKAPAAPPTPPAASRPDVQSPQGSQDNVGPPAQGGGRKQESPPARKPARPSASPDEPVEDAPTRAPEDLPASKGLLSVRLIYLDEWDGGAAGEVREAFGKELVSTGRFAVSGTRAGTDAVFEGSVTRLKGGGVSVRLRLVNERGEVVWPTTPRKQWAIYTGRRPDITKRIVEDILDEIRRLEGRR